MTATTLTASFADGVCRVRFTRPEAGNTITSALVREFDAVLRRCEDDSSGIIALVLEGSPEVFCTGGDLEPVARGEPAEDPGPLYDLWQRLGAGPFVSVAVVRGRVNAGGVGFVAACDLVLAGPDATFGLSEMLFGLFPACVLPFLIRRIGRQKAHVMTLTTRPLAAEEALAAGLVDALDPRSDRLLLQHLMRLRRLSRPAIARYRRYMAVTADASATVKPIAVAANLEMFSDPAVRHAVRRYVTEQKFPWEE